MSKIPQGEWNAIAARYEGGESISRIARSYGCTPPAIHYILKQNRQRPGQVLVQPAVRPVETVPTGLVRASGPEASPAANQERETLENGQRATVLVRASAPEATPTAILHGEKFTNGTRPALVRVNPPEPAAKTPLSPTPMREPITAPPVLGISGIRNTGPSPGAVAASPVPRLPGLDNELHMRAEAAIALFRSSFDAALAEGSPSVRERLRQAATDLMRVAARTTMVLDRLNASIERSARAHNYPRSAHSGEDFGKFG